MLSKSFPMLDANKTIDLFFYANMVYKKCICCFNCTIAKQPKNPCKASELGGLGVTVKSNCQKCDNLSNITQILPCNGT